MADIPGQADMFGGPTEPVRKPKSKPFAGMYCPTGCGHLNTYASVVTCKMYNNRMLAGQESKNGSIRFIRCYPCIQDKPMRGSHAIHCPHVRPADLDVNTSYTETASAKPTTWVVAPVDDNHDI